MNDTEILDFMAEYVNSFDYVPATEETNGVFVLEVEMVGFIKSQVSLRDAIEQANEEMQKVNS